MSDWLIALCIAIAYGNGVFLGWLLWRRPQLLKGEHD